eukprot:s978_g23.t2
MALLLGSGGAVKRTRSDKCALYTPDKSDWWMWPYTMLQPIQCRRSHDLKLARVSNHHCDGCLCDIDSGEKIHRCPECDFDLCNECAEKQATWYLGKNVTIRCVSVEEAEGIQTAGPGWSSSMEQDLGETREIESFSGGRCQLDGRWWMLGLLEAGQSAGASVSYTEGLFVKIKHTSPEEARRIFRAADIPFNSAMDRFLGTGGAIRRLRGNKCDVHTPDRSDYWTWPHEILEQIKCGEDHDLQRREVSGTRRCDGCQSRIHVGESAYQCEGCDFDLCDECAEKQATWCVGQRVKIRSVSVEEAERIQDRGEAGWFGSMQGDLGEVKEIQQFGAGRCQLAGGRWWMLGLLDVSGRQADDSSAIRVGAMVRVRDGVSPRYGWGGVQGQRGQVIEIEDDGDVRVRFPSSSRWRGVPSELEVCGEDRAPESTRGIRVGSLVRVRDTVSSPRYSWGSVSRGEVGRVVLLQDDGVRIDFPSQSGWHGVLSEMELCEEGEEDSDDASLDSSQEADVSRGAFPVLARVASNQIATSGTEEPQYGGHEEDWADEEAAAEFNCPICFNVCRDAVMHSCRTIFCESCWNFCHASDDRCPACRKTEHPAQQAYQQQWDIGKLLIKCPRKCGEAFSLSEKEQLLPKHLEECSYREEACPHCGVQVGAAQLTEHLEAECEARPECPLCGIKVAASALEEHMESASTEHMAALIREVFSLKAEVKGLREEVQVLKEGRGESA